MSPAEQYSIINTVIYLLDQRYDPYHSFRTVIVAKANHPEI